VIFDLDGTLLDTIDDLTDSMNWALARHGVAPHTPDACRYFVGDGVEVFARRALGERAADAKLVASVVAAYRRRYADHWADKTRPYPGVAELLAGLDRRGLKKAVFSNKPDDTTRLTVATLLKDFRFDIVRGARADVPLKPDPAGALALAADLGAAPARALYLGDTNTDMQTAWAAGFYPVGALWGFRTADELLSNGAKALVERPTDVLELLDGKP
jgi:phosphoglycolate phosphatase